MKLHISFTLIIAMLLTLLCACNKQPETSPADTYIAMAQDFLDKGDTAAALDILNKGFETTKDEKIAVMLAELSLQNDTTTTTEPTVSTDTTNNATEVLTSAGIWAETDISADSGGLILDLTPAGDRIDLKVLFTEAAPNCRIAEFSASALMADIQGNSLTLAFNDDGWGNAGTLVLTAVDGNIACAIKDTKYMIGDGAPDWCIPEGEYQLTKQDDAYEKLGNSMNEYYDDTLEDPTPQYDMSKASGILASRGMTAEEFRNSCTILHINPDKATLEAVGAEYINAHPGIDVKSLDIPKFDTGGVVVSNDKYTFEEQCFDVGRMLLHYPTGQLMQKMQEYPADYIGNAYCLLNVSGAKNIAYDGTIYYQDYCVMYYNSSKTVSFDINIIDYRDDVNYPTIYNDEKLNCYVIYLGTTYDGEEDCLNFALIDVDKIK